MFLTRAWFGAFGAATLALLLVSSPSFAFAQVSSTTLTTSATSTDSTSPSTNVVPIDPHNQADVSRAVADYFAGIPVMYEIAKCESGFTQYNTNGTTLNGGSGGMLGVFQINGAVHKSFAATLGDDITTLAGNMAYAKYLYDESGTEPWTSSEPCWSGTDAAGAVANILGTAANKVVSIIAPQVASASTSVPSVAPIINDVPKTPTLSTNLKLGTTGAQVVALQKLLNAAGYYIAKSGAGSPGQETSTFGPATRLAVERFQCASGIVCHGTEGSTGYGYVGAKTRAALL